MVESRSRFVVVEIQCSLLALDSHCFRHLFDSFDSQFVDDDEIEVVLDRLADAAAVAMADS